jgi:UDP-N-acetyl-alpha-D-muramoyl-L-alanyl-L-glutamate epimerase
MNQKAQSFDFSSYFFDVQKKEASFTYAITFENDEKLTFTEKIVLPSDQALQSHISTELIDNLLHSLHLILGISYWKLYCPSNITISTKPLTEEQAEFWNTVYTKGLGEFFYRNKIHFKGLVKFPYIQRDPSTPLRCAQDDKARALVGIGGGKDSIVAYELLKKLQIPVTGYILETQKRYNLIDKVVEVMNIGTIRVQRLIDPQLFDANNLPGAYNGHIPITAIYSFTALLCAILYGYNYIVLATERSANIGNVEWDGEMVNHQWSKSEEFERLFQQYVKTFITSDVEYFSLLRPLYEIKIVELFSHYPQYFSVFSSCNRNFKVQKESGLHGTLWCGECPKCAFMFALLAAFISKEKLVTIFGKNLFADEQLISVYKELLGIAGFKPFECVGTPEETKVAFWMAMQKGEYKDDVIMKMFEKEVVPTLYHPEELQKEMMNVGNTSLLPLDFRSVITE